MSGKLKLKRSIGMICDGVFCENQRDIVIEALKMAKHSVVIAVAWINFNEYGSTINELLQNGVNIRIVVNDDVKNAKYAGLIGNLQNNGLQYKMIHMPKNSNYMHHKFCVIDKTMCMMGSFNWTKNANENNFEDLSISHDRALVEGYVSQFETIWSLSIDDFIRLKKPEICESCGQPKAYLCVFEQEGYYQTKADIYEVCGCGDLKWVNNEFFDVSVYINLMGIFERYSDMDEEDFLNGFTINEQERKRALDYEISNYLSNVRSDRMGCPIIHAVGIYGWKPIYKDDGENIIQVLWKERYTSNYVMDEYVIGEV